MPIILVEEMHIHGCQSAGNRLGRKRTRVLHGLRMARLALVLLAFSQAPLPALQIEAQPDQHTAQFEIALWCGAASLAALVLFSIYQTVRVRKERELAAAARKQADESQQRFDAFMERTPTPTFLRDENGVLIYANEAFARGAGVPCSELIGKDGYSLWPGDFADSLRQADRSVLADGVAKEFGETIFTKDGRTLHFLSIKFPVVQQGRRMIGGIALDITERKLLEEESRFTQFAIDRSPDLILWIDSDLRIIYANQSACTTLGYRREELMHMEISDIDAGKTTECLKRRSGQLNAGPVIFESFHVTRIGTLLPVEVSLNYLEFDGKEFGCCISRNISERRRAEQDLSHQAHHDDLTGLPNRRLLELRLNQEIGIARRNQSMLAVMMFDLDGFKLINDSLGHSFGDRLLKQLAARFAASLPESGTLARMGGDEFTVLVTNVASEDDALAAAQLIQNRLQEVIALDGHELMITSSAGISMFPRDGADSKMLMKSADAAMYESKRAGKNRVQFFSPQMSAQAHERLELENLLRRALERNEFLVYFQPQLSLKTNTVVRYEALLRWNQPALGMIPPTKFIPIAEETHLIEPIGRWVLEESCRQVRNMELATGQPAGVAVNVSGVQFLRADFVPSVLDILQRTGLAPHLLELEITESVVMQGIGDVTNKIEMLRACGITVSIDDFGTGYSSLSYLQQLPIDTLKVDRSFLRLIPGDENAVSMLDAVVAMAHSLNMKVVIEGVETAEQLQVMRNIGGDMVQGFYLARPAPLGVHVEMTQALTALTDALHTAPEHASVS